MSPLIPGPGHPVGTNPDWHLERPQESTTNTADSTSDLIVDLPTAASTHEFGRNRLAPVLEPGDLIIASGPLGAGKTALVQGIGAGLGVEGRVLSPTFVIARVHRGGRLPLVHVDAYRLGSVREIDHLDLDAVLADSVMVVEWGEGLAEHLTDEYLLIQLSLHPDSAGSLPNRPFAGVESAGEEFRTARLTAHGSRWRARLPAVME